MADDVKPLENTPDMPVTNPRKKFIRDVNLNADIYEYENYGDEETNRIMAELIRDVQMSITLNVTNPADVPGNVTVQAQALNKLGIAYYRLVRFDRAEICHQKHLQLSEPADKKEVAQRNRKINKVEMKIALVNLGCVFAIKRDYELALSAYGEAIKIAEELEDMPSQARILANMSNAYRNLHNFDAAIECEEKRMDILGELCDINGQIKCFCSLGCLYQLLGEIRNSLMYYNKAVINLRMKILTAQLEEINGALGEEAGEIETRIP